MFLKKIIEYKGEFCYIPPENECFRKILEFSYEKDFSQQYRGYIQDSYRCKNLLTKAKIQPFCEKYNISLGVYNVENTKILPATFTERRLCLFPHNNHFCVFWKENRSSFPNAIIELEKNFKHKDNQITDDILKKVIEYGFPISYEIKGIYVVFALDLETYNVEKQLVCEPYAAGVYHPNRFYKCYIGELTEEELEIERENVHLYDSENNNPVMDMVSYVIENYKRKPKFITNKHN